MLWALPHPPALLTTHTHAHTCVTPPCSVFDDPLSALDHEVGTALFRQAIVKLLAHKTRILVTNQLQFLSECDRVRAPATLRACS